MIKINYYNNNYFLYYVYRLRNTILIKICIIVVTINKVDQERESKTTEIRDAYDIAVAELRDDF